MTDSHDMPRCLEVLAEALAATAAVLEGCWLLLSLNDQLC